MALMTAVCGFSCSLIADKIEPAQWVANNQIKESKVEGDIFTGKTTGKDPNIMAKGVKPFAATENDLVRFEMKVQSGMATSGEFFWFTSAKPGFVGNQMASFAVIADDNWHVYEIEMSAYPLWKDQIAGLRLDPVAGPKADGLFSVRNFEVTAQTEKKLPVNSWKNANYLKNRKDADGVLSYEFSGKDPSISIAPKFSAAKFNVLKFEMLLGSEATPDTQVFWCNQETKNFSEKQTARFKSQNDGQWHEYTIDLSLNPAWIGIITGLRIDPTNAPGNAPAVQFRNIRVETKK